MSEYLETTIDKFIFCVATDRLYTPEGVWALLEGDRVRVGLTDYQQQLNGDMAFVHLKPAGTKFAVGDELAELETIKATVSLFSPVSGTLVKINPDLDFSPEFVNQDPYGKGWLVMIESAQWDIERVNLIDAKGYLEWMRSQAEQELKK